MPLHDSFTESQIFPLGTGSPIIMEAVDLCMTFDDNRQ